LEKNIALFSFGRIGRNIFCLGCDNPNYWYDNESGLFKQGGRSAG